MKIERFFTAPALITVNVAIIVAAETVGGGTFFHESGLIHAIAVLFIVLAATRIFTRFYLFDPELQFLLRASLTAMAFFAISHFVEFAAFQLSHGYSDAAFANVVNFYAISLLIMLYGAETVIVRYRKKGEWVLGAIAVAIAGLLVLTALFMSGQLSVSLEPDEPTPYLYAFLTFAAWGLCLLRWNSVRKMYAWFSRFTNTVMLSAFMVMLAAMPNIFYELLEHAGISEVKSIYLSHFTFYAALSVMYLGYDQVQKLGGLHKDLREEMQNATP